jgi:hypothetical protein
MPSLAASILTGGGTYSAGRLAKGHVLLVHVAPQPTLPDTYFPVTKPPTFRPVLASIRKPFYPLGPLVTEFKVVEPLPHIHPAAAVKTAEPGTSTSTSGVSP